MPIYLCSVGCKHLVGLVLGSSESASSLIACRTSSALPTSGGDLLARAVAMFAPILHAQVERGRVESEFEDVRFGSKAEVKTFYFDVRFTPNSGHGSVGL